MFEPVRPVRAYERVIEQIDQALRTGELAPGDRLPSERELMRQLHVSRSTVREALRVLESNGRLRLRQGDPHGAQLLPLSADSLRGPLVSLASSGEVSFESLLQFRILLDGASSFVAARTHDEAQLEQIRVALDALAESVAHGRHAWSEADFAFHEAIARASGNPLLRVCSEVVRTVATAMIEDSIAADGDESALMRRWVRLHRSMFELISARDAAGAAAQAQRDLIDQYGPHLAADRRALLESWVGDATPVPSAIDARPRWPAS